MMVSSLRIRVAVQVLLVFTAQILLACAAPEPGSCNLRCSQDGAELCPAGTVADRSTRLCLCRAIEARQCSRDDIVTETGIDDAGPDAAGDTGPPGDASTHTEVSTPEPSAPDSATDAGVADSAVESCAPSSCPLTLIESDLAAAVLGRPYAVELRAEGGTPPYEYTRSDSSLLCNGDFNPAWGLTLSEGGSISGRPQEAGDFCFAVQVTDAAGNVDIADFPLTVSQLSHRAFYKFAQEARPAGDAGVLPLGGIAAKYLDDGTAKRTEFVSGRAHWSLMDVSPNGEWLYYHRCSVDGPCLEGDGYYLQRTREGEPPILLQLEATHNGALPLLAWSPDGSYAAIAHTDAPPAYYPTEARPILIICGLMTGKCEKLDLENTEAYLSADMMLPNGYDPLWSADSRSLLFFLGRQVGRVHMDPSGTVGSVEVLDPLSSQQKEAAQDGLFFKRSPASNSVLVWDIELEVAFSIGFSGPTEVRSPISSWLYVSPFDGAHSQAADDLITLWGSGGQQLWRQSVFYTDNYNRNLVAFAREAQRVLVPGHILDYSQAPVKTFGLPGGETCCAALSADGQRVLLGTDSLGPPEFSVWELPKNSTSWPKFSRLGVYAGRLELSGQHNPEAFSPDARWLALAEQREDVLTNQRFHVISLNEMAEAPSVLPEPVHEGDYFEHTWLSDSSGIVLKPSGEPAVFIPVPQPGESPDPNKVRVIDSQQTSSIIVRSR